MSKNISEVYPPFCSTIFAEASSALPSDVVSQARIQLKRESRFLHGDDETRRAISRELEAPDPSRIGPGQLPLLLQIDALVDAYYEKRRVQLVCGHDHSVEVQGE